ncbi:MAG: hypothetical protein ACKOC5_02850 [Chloroflexota bacterium]
MDKAILNAHLKRIAILSLAAGIFALIFNELTFRLQAGESDRAPRTVTFVIPQGTAGRIAAGEQVKLFPDEVTFVVGDVLEVKNEDQAAHQLGPVWVPAGSTGRLQMDRAAQFSYDCSFQSSQYLGLEVRPATTWVTRLTALLLTGPTLAVLLYLYSLAARPITAPSKAA